MPVAKSADFRMQGAILSGPKELLGLSFLHNGKHTAVNIAESFPRSPFTSSHIEKSWRTALISIHLTFRMASNNEEPSLKRFRLLEEKKEPSTRFIKLDMEKCDGSVQAYSDEDLIKIFELGLKVKESASLNFF